MDLTINNLVKVRNKLESQLEHSSNCELLLKYIVAVQTLLEFAHENNFKAFALTFATYKITIADITKCVPISDKQEIYNLFNDACQNFLRLNN